MKWRVACCLRAVLLFIFMMYLKITEIPFQSECLWCVKCLLMCLHLSHPWDWSLNFLKRKKVSLLKCNKEFTRFISPFSVDKIRSFCLLFYHKSWPCLSLLFINGSRCYTFLSPHNIKQTDTECVFFFSSPHLERLIYDEAKRDLTWTSSHVAPLTKPSVILCSAQKLMNYFPTGRSRSGVKTVRRSWWGKQEGVGRMMQHWSHRAAGDKTLQ